MPIPMIDKVSSFLHQFSLAHQLSLMQRDIETLAREEAYFMEVTGRTISLLTSRHEEAGFPPSTSSQPAIRATH